MAMAENSTSVSNDYLVGDLGNGVMDDALVMSAAYVVTKDESSTECISFGDLRREADKESSLLQAIQINSFKEIERAFFRDLPGGKLIYGAPRQIATMFKASTQLEPTIATVRKGLTTFDDFRYLRLRWEISGESIGKGNKWEFFAKGGEYAVYYTDIHLVVKRENNGSELAETNRLVNGQVAQSRQASSFYYQPGCQFTSRSASGFSARAIPAECTWSSNAPMILTQSDVDSSFILGHPVIHIS